MSDYPTEGAMVSALMRSAGVTELRVPDEWLINPRVGSVLRYRDEAAAVTVFRLVVPADVIDGEEVAPDRSLPAGTAGAA